ncbi:MAG: hypothetical protein KIS76_15340 [Pyrinomonadaceae bacterium]|nr:hypothetical protein [Pyrinomonadaceae bacterium]
MTFIFAASEVAETSSGEALLAIGLFILMGVSILALGLFVGVKAFRSTKKDD